MEFIGCLAHIHFLRNHFIKSPFLVRRIGAEAGRIGEINCLLKEEMEMKEIFDAAENDVVFEEIEMNRVKSRYISGWSEKNCANGVHGKLEIALCRMVPYVPTPFDNGPYTVVATIDDEYCYDAAGLDEHSAKEKMLLALWEYGPQC